MATQHGIAYIYVFAQIVLLALTLLFAVLFPVTKKEFDIIRKDVARRKGEEKSQPTAEEVAVCEKVTGYRYDKLWNRDNAVKLHV